MESIPSVQNPSLEGEDDPQGTYWAQTKECAGFVVSEDCPWRYEEMSLIGYTPAECFEDPSMGCD